MTSTPLNPNPSVGYDCWSTLYDLLYEGTYGEQYHHMTESHLALLDNFAGKVLDIGAGTGRIAVPLAQRGRTITAVEGVSLLEFGTPEAMWHLRIADFPAIVTMDAHGNSLHRDVEQESAKELAGTGA